MKRIHVIGRDPVPQSLTLGGGESLEMVLVCLPGISCNVPLEVRLCGAGASLDLYGLYLCLDDESVRLDINVRHESGQCRSSQLIKGICAGCATFDFHGLVYVRKDAQKTKAFQQNNNILLSDKAHAYTKPQLEIYADDVECSHGATIGRLDEDELFYMRSRGIPEKEARKLQILSFLSPVLEQLDDDLRKSILDSLSAL